MPKIIVFAKSEDAFVFDNIKEIHLLDSVITDIRVMNEIHLRCKPNLNWGGEPKTKSSKHDWLTQLKEIRTEITAAITEHDADFMGFDEEITAALELTINLLQRGT